MKISTAIVLMTLIEAIAGCGGSGPSAVCPAAARGCASRTAVSRPAIDGTNERVHMVMVSLRSGRGPRRFKRPASRLAGAAATPR